MSEDGGLAAMGDIATGSLGRGQLAAMQRGKKIFSLSNDGNNAETKDIFRENIIQAALPERRRDAKTTHWNRRRSVWPRSVARVLL